MNAREWRALADEYYAIARQHEQAGNTDAARYWRRAADACREEARKLDAEHQREQEKQK